MIGSRPKYPEEILDVFTFLIPLLPCAVLELMCASMGCTALTHTVLLCPGCRPFVIRDVELFEAVPTPDLIILTSYGK